MAENCYNKGVKERRGCHCSEATQKYLEHPANSNIETLMKKCYISLLYDYAITQMHKIK